MIARNLLSSASVVRRELMSPIAMLFRPGATLWKAADDRGVVRRDDVLDIPWNIEGLSTPETRLPWSKPSSNMAPKSRLVLSSDTTGTLLSTVLVTWSVPGERRATEFPLPALPPCPTDSAMVSNKHWSFRAGNEVAFRSPGSYERQSSKSCSKYPWSVASSFNPDT